jgi:hypothetical protein
MKLYLRHSRLIGFVVGQVDSLRLGYSDEDVGRRTEQHDVNE